MSGGFNGVYDVTATIRDTAGNTRTDSTNDEVATDSTAPFIDLDPSAAGRADGTTVDTSVISPAGALVSLDDNADPATILEASDL